MPAPPGWKMQVFEIVPALSIATRLDTSSEYRTLDVDVIVDLEDWEAAWAPPVPLGRLYVSFPMDDGDDVDPKVRELAVFIAALVTAGRRVLVHCTEGLNRSGVVVARALMEMGSRPATPSSLFVDNGDQASMDSPRLVMTPSLIGCIEKATRHRPEPHRDHPAGGYRNRSSGRRPLVGCNQC